MKKMKTFKDLNMKNYRTQVMDFDNGYRIEVTNWYFPLQHFAHNGKYKWRVVVSKIYDGKYILQYVLDIKTRWGVSRVVKKIQQLDAEL